VRIRRSPRNGLKGPPTEVGQYLFRVAAVSDRGLERPNNEDSLLVLRLLRHRGDEVDDVYLLAVADGMGGAARGEVASNLALTEMATYLSEHVGDAPRDDLPGQSELLANAFSSANERVFKGHDPRSEEKMGTTLVVAYAVGTELFLGHAGDSRCYLLRGQEIRRATKDDSVVQKLMDAGVLTEVEAASHPQRHQITNGIGLFPGTRFKATVRHVGNVREYDHLLLCSDGLHGVVGDAEIARIVREASDMGEGARELVRAANAGGGPDNISLILAGVGGSSQRRQRGRSHGPDGDEESQRSPGEIDDASPPTTSDGGPPVI